MFSETKDRCSDLSIKIYKFGFFFFVILRFSKFVFRFFYKSVGNLKYVK